MTDTQTEGVFEGWVIAEFMGHRKLGGYLKEITLAGQGFLRLDVFSQGENPIATQFYSPSSIYCITPCTEELARGLTFTSQPQPVTRWELPSATVRSASQEEEFEYDEEEEEGWNR